MARDVDECPERLGLGQKVSEAIRRVYSLREKYDAAKGSKTASDSIDALLASLQQTRADELVAERAYREHVENHVCLNRPADRSPKNLTKATVAVV